MASEASRKFCKHYFKFVNISSNLVDDNKNLKNEADLFVVSSTLLRKICSAPLLPTSQKFLVPPVAWRGDTMNKKTGVRKQGRSVRIFKAREVFV